MILICVGGAAPEYGSKYTTLDVLDTKNTIKWVLGIKLEFKITEGE